MSNIVVLEKKCYKKYQSIHFQYKDYYKIIKEGIFRTKFAIKILESEFLEVEKNLL